MNTSVNGFLLGIVNFLDKYAGLLFSAAFFGFMFWLFYWLIVVVPRRIKVFFKNLEKKGFQLVDTEDKDFKDAFTRLAPPHPSRLSGGSASPWTVRNAAKKVGTSHIDYIAHANRSQGRGGGTSRKTVKDTIFLFQARKLPIDDRIYITPKKNPGGNLWEERYNAFPVTAAYETDLQGLYDFYSPGSTPIPLPGDLSRVLIDICPAICRRELFCFQNGINFMFCPDGWGMCPDNYVYKEEHFDLLLNIFEKISDSLEHNREE